MAFAGSCLIGNWTMASHAADICAWTPRAFGPCRSSELRRAVLKTRPLRSAPRGFAFHRVGETLQIDERGILDTADRINTGTQLFQRRNNLIHAMGLRRRMIDQAVDRKRHRIVGVRRDAVRAERRALRHAALFLR